ncbi:MAG: chaperone NapD [Stappiaceae bacterium]
MINICGCLVHATLNRVADVIAAIETAEGSEVHGHDAGRIVVTVEDTKTKRASEQIMDMHQIPGVLTVTLTYHHFEELTDTAQSASAPCH